MVAATPKWVPCTGRDVASPAAILPATTKVNPASHCAFVGIGPRARKSSQDFLTGGSAPMGFYFDKLTSFPAGIKITLPSF